MDFFNFNKLYVIESLECNKTGKELYDSLLQYMPIKYPELHTSYIDINSRSDWDNLMAQILDECREGITPLFHLEIHGDDSGAGISLKNGDLVSIDTIGEQFRKINCACGCNLFVTLGVCKGLYILFNMLMDRPMPFIGAIGSFTNIGEVDLSIRYYEFYDMLFSTFDIAKSFVALSKANPGIPSTYQYIPADEIFYKCYHDYLTTKCTDTVLEQRAIESMPDALSSRQQRRKFIRNFKKDEHKHRERFFKKHAASFFMTKEYPDNAKRFNVPQTFHELETRYNNIVLLTK